jgi:excisionase family DNA binding protein
MTKLAYSVREAAEACSVSPDTVRRAIRANQLPVRLNGTRQLILASDLLAWVESLPSERSAS